MAHVNTRRVKRMLVSSDLLLHCLGPFPQGRVVRFVSDEIPEDAHLLAIQMSGPWFVELWLASEQFPEVAEGEEAPQLMPRYEAMNIQPMTEEVQ